MAEDILLKVRLDTSGARSDLKSLYGDMARAPRTAVSAGGAPGGGGGGGGSGGGGGGGGSSGGISLGSILAKLAAILAAQQLIGTGAGLAAGSVKDIARDAIFGGQLGQARGMSAARDAVAGRLGLAYEHGLISDNQLKQAFQMEKQFGSGAQERGRAKAKAALGGELLENLAVEGADIVGGGAAMKGFIESLGVASDVLNGMFGK